MRDLESESENACIYLLAQLVRNKKTRSYDELTTAIVTMLKNQGLSNHKKVSHWKDNLKLSLS